MAEDMENRTNKKIMDKKENPKSHKREPLHESNGGGYGKPLTEKQP